MISLLKMLIVVVGVLAALAGVAYFGVGCYKFFRAFPEFLWSAVCFFLGVIAVAVYEQI